MCREMELMRDRSRAEGALKQARETALNLFGMGMNAEFIAKAVNVSLEQVKQWLSPVST